MKQEKIEVGPLYLVGVSVRTNNKAEMQPGGGKIGPLVANYQENRIADGLQHRLSPGVTYMVYTDFESNEHGAYTYFLGEVVESLEDQDLSEFRTVTIPESTYQKFTTDPGKMPEVVITAWQEIWTMDSEKLGGRRKYLADFEVHDQRAENLSSAVVDIYIGV